MRTKQQQQQQQTTKVGQRKKKKKEKEKMNVFVFFLSVYYFCQVMLGYIVPDFALRLGLLLA